MASFAFRVKRMDDQRLDQAVDLAIGGKVITAASLSDAAEILLEEWPADTAVPAHRAARAAVLAAMEGNSTVKAARIALERAARAARIHVDTRAHRKQRDALREVMERLGHPAARRAPEAAPAAPRKPRR